MYFLCDAPADTGRFKWFIETLTAELCNSDPVWTGLKLNDEPTATCPVRACWSSAWSGFNGLKRHSMRSLCLFLTRLCVWFWWGRAHWALIGPFVYVDVCSGSRDLNFKFNFKEKMKWLISYWLVNRFLWALSWMWMCLDKKSDAPAFTPSTVMHSGVGRRRALERFWHCPALFRQRALPWKLFYSNLVWTSHGWREKISCHLSK